LNSHEYVLMNTDNSADRASQFMTLGALLVALATIIGAFGVHALKTRLPLDRYEVLQTAVHYQFFHALGLVALGLIIERRDSVALRAAGWLCFAGVLLFSGSLYAITAGAPTAVGVVTPIGGLCLISAWLLAAWSLSRRRASHPV
jgi:uncharacterized membrane protein YgdD (TMEM256/DUF423 family)